MVEKFKSTAGFDAANQKLVNVADGDSAQDGVNIRVLEKKNTVQSHSTTRTYDLGFIVEYMGQLWKCTTPVTTAGVFNAASWTALSGRENWIRLTANYTAGVMDSLYVDAATAITVTLPASPKSGDYVIIIDGAGFASQRPITIARNGITINGAATDLILNEDEVRCTLVYLGGTWKTIYAKAERVRFTGSSSFTALSNLEYLIDVTANFAVALPASPKVGDQVNLIDYNGGLGTNTITVQGNGKQVDGASSVAFNTKKGRLNLFYNGTQWISYLTQSNTLQADKNLSDLPSKSTARANLELGSAALLNAGTGNSEVQNNAQNIAAYQPKDTTLTGLAALITAANQLIYSTGPDSFAMSALTAQARAFLAAVDQPAQRSALGLGTASTFDVGQAAGNVLQTGAFGLGASSVAVDNLDTLSKTGFYSAIPGTTGNPASTYRSSVVHIEHGASSPGGMQFAVASNGSMYTRNRASDGSWSSWGEIAGTGLLGSAAYKNAGTIFGNVMEVGAFGLGWTPAMINDLNSNSYPTGFYRFDSATANRPTEIPAGYVSIIWEDNSNFQQIAYHSASNIIVRRVCYSGSFGPWGYIHTNLTVGSAIIATVGTMIGSNGDPTKPIGAGAFGLGTNNYQPNWPNTDLADCSNVRSGVYRTIAGTTGYPGTGTEQIVEIWFRDIATAGQFKALQRCTNISNNKIFQRTAQGAGTAAAPAWGPWVEVFTSVSISPNWTSVTYANGWTDYDSSANDGAQYRLEGNRVWLRGVVKNPTATVAAIATLPSGYRPLKTKILSTARNVSGSQVAVFIDSAGVITPAAYDASNSPIFLDGLCFEID